jgi:acylphosphatase
MRYRLIIHGQVQGVFYRVSAREQAQKLGLTGWVKNTYNRSVEIEVQGTKELLAQFIDWCAIGPSYAKVDLVEKELIPDLSNEQSFRITF